MSEIISTKKKWEDWAVKLQAIAQTGLYYTDNEFELERYREIRKIACEILDTHTQDNIEKNFCKDIGYATPKIDTRSVCFKDNKILLAQEKNGNWSIPGGWSDIDQTIRNNVIKEAFEETGAKVDPQFVICIHDWKSHVNVKNFTLPFQIQKIFVYCKLIEQKFKANSETLQADFFEEDKLPKLALGKNTLEQIKICFDAHRNKDNWKTQFD